MASLGHLIAFLMVFLPFICGITPVFAFSQDIEDAQVLLNSLGFDVGPEDGISGDRTKSALIEFYTSQNKTFDGLLSENELADLMDFIDEQAQKQSNTNQETSGPLARTLVCHARNHRPSREPEMLHLAFHVQG